MTIYRFNGRATGSDPTGYFYPRWDLAQSVSILARSGEEAVEKAVNMLGTHNRFGVSGFGDRRDTPGWAIRWDSVDEVLESGGDI